MLNTELSFDPAILLQYVSPKVIKESTLTDTLMFLAELFTQPKQLNDPDVHWQLHE